MNLRSFGNKVKEQFDILIAKEIAKVSKEITDSMEEQVKPLLNILKGIPAVIIHKHRVPNSNKQQLFVETVKINNPVFEGKTTADLHVTANCNYDNPNNDILQFTIRIFYYKLINNVLEIRYQLSNKTNQHWTFEVNVSFLIVCSNTAKINLLRSNPNIIQVDQETYKAIQSGI